MIFPGETEAGTQQCGGLAWWSYRCVANPHEELGFGAQPPRGPEAVHFEAATVNHFWASEFETIPYIDD
jgi:hypothetical protein